MLLRALLFVLSTAALAVPSSGQITLDRNSIPFEIGVQSMTGYEADNEDGSNTAAINAIIAASGPDRIYDFTAIDYEAQETIQLLVEPGAVGPGAEVAPFSSANLTLSVTGLIEDDEGSVSGTTWSYLLVTDEAMFDLGSAIQIEGSIEVASSLKNLPAGDLTAQFPYTFGDSWTSMIEEVFEFGPISFSIETTKEYSVDGWGSLLAPGLPSAVPVLRIRREENWEQFGESFTDICYEFRSSFRVLAEVCEPQPDGTPTATLTLVGTGSTSADADMPHSRFGLHPIYPNPALLEIQLHYELEQNAQVELRLFDVLGRAVRDVVATVQPPGAYDQVLSVSDLSPGLYVARLSAGGRSWARTVVLLP